MLIFIKTCEWCGAKEERSFYDSWSGLELCLACLGEVVAFVTNSPATEGDNLKAELQGRVGPRMAS